ncbi:hypothetical protein KCU98_g5642, partial [Aureobasidium melanogenum]
MDEDSLGHILFDMEEKIYRLAELLEDHERRYETASITADPHPCLSLVENLRTDIKRVNKEANDMLKMIQHIADKVIKDTVDHLAHKMRSNSPQSQLATSMINLYFEGPGSDQRRKDIEVRLKDNFPELRSVCDGSFEQALPTYEEKVEEMALKYANEDMKKIVDAITRAEDT